MEDLDDVVDRLMLERFAPTSRQREAASALAEMDPADYGPSPELDAEGMTLCCGTDYDYRTTRYGLEMVCLGCRKPVEMS